MRTCTPRDAEEACEIVAAALGSGQRFELVGGGRCRDYGRPVQADALLDLSALRGVTVYEPEELVLSARAATPLAEIAALLSRSRQHLAFEPPDLGPLWGREPGSGTLGGVLMLGLGGPRRATAGAPRDHFLGFKGINGHAQTFAAGGRVVKNVTGFDLPKLLAGSMGTLGVLTEVTLKVLPMPERVSTLAVPALSAPAALSVLTSAVSGPAQVTGGAYLPERIAARSALPVLSAGRCSFTLLRLEGFAPSVQWSAQHLAGLLATHSKEPPLCIGSEDSVRLWTEVGSARFFADGSMSPVWRLSVEPARAAEIVARIEAHGDGVCYFDGFGGVVWAQVLEDHAGDAGALLVRGALCLREATVTEGITDGVPRATGHATLVRASAPLRERVPSFQPLEPGLAALTRRVKQQFDPKGLFNPGRMYEGI